MVKSSREFFFFLQTLYLWDLKNVSDQNKKTFMDDRYLIEVVFNAFHFIDRHFHFSVEVFKQIQFLMSIDFFFEHFIWSDKKLCTVGKCYKTAYV